MKILLLSRYERLGASSRVRMLQYLPYLRANGVDVTVAPLFTDTYLRCYYRSGKKHLAEVIQSYARRVPPLLGASSYDLLWIEKELFPFVPALGERLLSLLGIPYVVDYDDAVFHNYDINPNPAVRLLLRRKIDVVMRQAAVVVVGNDYLAERARRAGARRVEVLPTVIDLERYRVVSSRPKELFTIGWIGSPSVTHYLAIAEPALKKFCGDRKTRVVLVGAGRTKLPAELRPWSEETEVSDILEFDVGIMPLPDTPWEQGKCGYKLIQYMGCGIPVVATPIGINTRIVDHGVNGFLADSDDEWVTSLSMLEANPALRQSMGTAGKKKVMEEYCLQVTAPRLYDLITSI